MNLLIMATLIAAVPDSLPGVTENTSVALVCPENLADNVPLLRSAGDEAAYNCLAEDDRSLELLLEESLSPNGQENHPERITRAMAVWRMHRLESEIPAEEARAYNPSDVRLLTDAINAYRGRTSPSPEHASVFEKFDWYAPSAQFTVARLTETDVANVAMLLDPPEPIPEAQPVETEAEASAQNRVRACSCSSGSTGSHWLLGLFGLMFYRFERKS
jgi:hypothetical protein